MEEKILQTKKNGMIMLLLTLLGYVVFTALFVYSLILLDTSLFPGILLMALSILYWVAGIFLFCGLKVLKPQEALVLTLFGDYDISVVFGEGYDRDNNTLTLARNDGILLKAVKREEKR